MKFQSTRPSRASTGFLLPNGKNLRISIRKALAGLDEFSENGVNIISISIHKALAGLDGGVTSD